MGALSPIAYSLPMRGKWEESTISADELAQLCGVSVRTARRWRAGRLPAYAVRLVALVSGELVQIDRAWKGWRLTPEGLRSPDGVLFTPGDIAAGPFQKQLIDELERQAQPFSQRALL